MSNISYYAIKTISLQKIKEFFFHFQYSIIAPLISSFLFIIILSIISNHYSLINDNINYIDFVVPGIIIIMVIQISYQNISESLIEMKQTASFNDYLISPISRIEILISLILSSIFNSVILGFTNIFLLNFFFNFIDINYLLVLFYLILTSLIFSSIGSIVGFLSYRWDMQQGFSNFFIIPVCYLSGTFFSLNSVNLNWQFILKYNPFYYLVNNFRKSFNNDYIIGSNNEILLIFFSLLFIIIAIFIFKKGYNVIL